jgi:inner membrane protein
LPTILTHAIAGIAIAQVFAPCSRRGEISLYAAGCAMLPDIDVLGFPLGIQYGDLFGHRGFTHSLLFGGLVAAMVTLLLRSKLPVFICLFIATASHGILDAFTDGGLGVAFLSPFDPARFFFSVRPILVSPLSASAFLSERGISVFWSEMVGVWTPSLAVFLAARFVRCRPHA